jgi:hypothetical protein
MQRYKINKRYKNRENVWSRWRRSVEEIEREIRRNLEQDRENSGCVKDTCN